jgi:AcrR family transcriptional regulator
LRSLIERLARPPVDVPRITAYVWRRRYDSSEQHSQLGNTVHCTVNIVHKQLRQLEGILARRDATTPVDDPASRPLWFAPPIDDRDRRRALTCERVVAEALTIISSHGVDALTMRALATRLGVVPSALYRHVRNLQQLHDLVLDGVLAEVDCTLDPSLAWTERVKLLARRLRTVLEGRPGIAGLLKTRDPLGPPHPRPSRSLPRVTPRSRLSRTRDGPGVLPDLRLQARIRAQQPGLGQRTARPRPSHPETAPRIPPIPAG